MTAAGLIVLNGMLIKVKMGRINKNRVSFVFPFRGIAFLHGKIRPGK